MCVYMQSFLLKPFRDQTVCSGMFYDNTFKFVSHDFSQSLL